MRKFKYFLITFIFMVLMIPNVNAEEYDTCYDDYLVGNVDWVSESTWYLGIKPYLPVKASTTYYVRFFISEDFKE